MKRPKGYEDVTHVRLRRGGTWQTAHDVYDEGVHVIIEQKHHWYKWAVIKQARKG